jgi:diguanylate cyclase (GGDEF)-like protein
MATGKNVERRGTEMPVLHVPRAEAESRLGKRISEGDELLAIRPRNESELDDLKERRRIWSDYNRDLLGTMFGVGSVVEEYSASTTGSFSMTPSFAERIEYVHKDVRTKVARLRSIVGRLELYDAHKANAEREKDELTGLLRRASFDSDICMRMEDARTVGSFLSIVYIDIDRFKQVNDNHGHPKGDAFLAGVAAVLARVVGEKGCVYRLGGEEMAMLLPNFDLQEAVAVAERSRRELEAGPIEALPITASFGVATFPTHATESKVLVGAADKAMYDAKNLGRNLVRVFGELGLPAREAREPERKLAKPGGLTEQQRSDLRTQYFTTGSIRCPLDGAILQVREFTPHQLATPLLNILCKLCGLREQI